MATVDYLTQLGVSDVSRFDGKSTIVTGAAGGIGSAIAERLAAEQADLLLCDIHEDGLESLAAQLSG